MWVDDCMVAVVTGEGVAAVERFHCVQEAARHCSRRTQQVMVSFIGCHISQFTQFIWTAINRTCVSSVGESCPSASEVMTLRRYTNLFFIIIIIIIYFFSLPTRSL